MKSPRRSRTPGRLPHLPVLELRQAVTGLRETDRRRHDAMPGQDTVFLMRVLQGRRSRGDGAGAITGTLLLLADRRARGSCRAVGMAIDHADLTMREADEQHG